MATEVWTEEYDRLAELIRAHRTTLVFVNTRRLAERAARHLAERLGEDAVTSHHGSLAKEHRLKAEQRLKAGELKALVATSSLELGIDIGDVDLVCQLGSPRAIAAFLQRVGRSGHGLGRLPKGRLFPLSRDDLVECAALLDAIRRGELDAIKPRAAPLDVLAQQIVAEVGMQRVAGRRAATRASRARRATAISARERVRRGRADARRRLHDASRPPQRASALRPRERRAARPPRRAAHGDHERRRDSRSVRLRRRAAAERAAGRHAERGLRIREHGRATSSSSATRRTASRRSSRARSTSRDAHGEPPTIPFWLGEAPGRSDELSASVGRLHETLAAVLDADGPPEPRRVARERARARRVGGRAARRVPRRREGRARRVADTSASDLRAVLRRDRRHASRDPFAVRLAR